MFHANPPRPRHALHGSLAILAAALLAGCAAPSPRQGGGKPAPGAALAMIEVLAPASPADLPEHLVVHVEAEDGSPPNDVVLDAETRIPGLDASFPMRLDLAPGRYRLARISGTAPRGVGGAAFDVHPGVVFTVGAPSPLYLGHLEIRAERRANAPDGPQAPPTVTDRATDDWPVFVRRWPGLRGSTPAFGLASVQGPASTQVAGAGVAPAEDGPRISGGHVEPVSLKAGDAPGLPPRARAAFARFVELPLPRAMTLSADGVPSLSSGTDAIDAALRRCGKHAVKKACRLFAVDDTLMDGIAKTSSGVVAGGSTAAMDAHGISR